MNELNMRMLVRMVMVQRMAVPQAVADRAMAIPIASAVIYSVLQGDKMWH